MIEKRTVIDQIEIARGGAVQVRFGLLLVEDGVEIDCKWHRSLIEPGIDPDVQLAAVNDQLTKMGKAQVGNDELVPTLKGVVAAVHTPDVVEAYRKRADASVMFEAEQAKAL
jgi:hypothetical protein